MNEVVAELLRRAQYDRGFARSLRRAPAQTLDRIRGLSARDRARLIDAARNGELDRLLRSKPVGSSRLNLSPRTIAAIRSHGRNDLVFLRALRAAPFQTIGIVRGIEPGDHMVMIAQDHAAIGALVIDAVVGTRGWRGRAPRASTDIVLPHGQQGFDPSKFPHFKNVPSGAPLTLKLADPPPGVFGLPDSGNSSINNPPPMPRAVKLWQITGGAKPLYWDGPKLVFEQETTDLDRHYGVPTRSRTVHSANVAATDLGIPLRVGDKLMFFFGDTWDFDPDVVPGFFDSGDPYGWTEAQQDVFTVPPWIRFFTATADVWGRTNEFPNQPPFQSGGTGYVPLLHRVLSDEELGGARGPMGAFYDSARDTAYVFFIADADTRSEPRQLNRTVIVAARGVSKTFTPTNTGGTWDVPKWEVINTDTGSLLRSVAPVLVDGTTLDPPENGLVVLMFGTDHNYNGSSVYLVRCSLLDLDPEAFGLPPRANPLPLRYLQWVDYGSGVPGAPHWTYNAKLAMPLFNGAYVGQLSVVQEPKTGLWLMAHEVPKGLTKSGGVMIRWAPTPWGPWGSTYMINPNNNAIDGLIMSQEPSELLYDTARDNGFGNIIHRLIDIKNNNAPIAPCLSIVAPSPVNGGYYDSKGDDRVADNLLSYLSDGEFGPYGPYLIADWFRYRKPDGNQVIDLVYTMATANPYMVVLMSTTFKVEKDTTTISFVQGHQSAQWGGGIGGKLGQ